MKRLPHFVQSPLLRSVPGVYHAFLGVDPVEGRGRRERLREVFSLPAETVGTLKQVHSASVLSFEPGDGDVAGGWKREGDALWTASPGTGVGVHTADCVPILLAHRKIPVAAAVHAGWRGLAAGIPAEQAEGAGPCTICSPVFHSFRREKSATARQLSFLHIRD